MHAQVQVPTLLRTFLGVLHASFALPFQARARGCTTLERCQTDLYARGVHLSSFLHDVIGLQQVAALFPTNTPKQMEAQFLISGAVVRHLGFAAYLGVAVGRCEDPLFPRP